MRYISDSVEETLKIAEKLGKSLKEGDVVSLQGPLGAGKTVIAKGVARALGITDHIVSPTFTIIQEYEGSEHQLNHMDLYRIEGEDEFEMLGGEEMLYSDAITLIEWSEKIKDMLPDHTIYITLEIDENQKRIITIEGQE